MPAAVQYSSALEVPRLTSVLRSLAEGDAKVRTQALASRAIAPRLSATILQALSCGADAGSKRVGRGTIGMVAGSAGGAPEAQPARAGWPLLPGPSAWRPS